MNDQSQIVDWLVNNGLTINNLLQYLNEERDIMLRAEIDFIEEINREYNQRAKSLIAQEISRQLGMQIDTIFEVLETPNIQEYWLNDGLCRNDNTIESA